MPRRIVPAATGVRVSTGTTGLMHSSSSAPCSSATEACSVLRSTPSTQYRPSTSTGGYTPGTAVLASTAVEIGTWSHSGSPNRIARPEPRSVATTIRRCRSSRKSSVRPGTEKICSRYRRMGSLSKTPTGSASPRRVSDSRSVWSPGRTAIPQIASVSSHGTLNARFASSQ
jgi:hypothetical protein